MSWRLLGEGFGTREEAVAKLPSLFWSKVLYIGHRDVAFCIYKRMRGVSLSFLFIQIRMIVMINPDLIRKVMSVSITGGCSMNCFVLGLLCCSWDICVFLYAVGCLYLSYRFFGRLGYLDAMAE